MSSDKRKGVTKVVIMTYNDVTDTTLVFDIRFILRCSAARGRSKLSLPLKHNIIVHTLE